jgi:uncharacterized membrane protein
MTNRRLNEDTRKLVYLAILTALVVVLQFVALITRAFLPITITLTLVPIVIGAAICGKWSGAWLGLIFGIIVLTTDSTVVPFLEFNFPATIVTVLLKGFVAGLAAGLIYSLLEKKNKYLAVFSSAVISPIVNTSIFVAGCYLFFYDLIKEEAKGGDVFWYVILFMVGVNFIVEFAINILLAPTILRLIDLKKKQ